ncbi:MAG: FG-GAP-like repeat-containing protein [Luteibaculum sp.]
MSSNQLYSKKARLRLLAEKWSKSTNHEEAERILKKIRSLLLQIQNWISKKEVLQILGSAALVLGLTINTNGQQFATPVSNPFGFTPTPNGYYVLPAFIDWDNDGDLDLISNDYNSVTYFYENTGSAQQPIFSTGEINKFDFSRRANSFGPATVGDIDNDGDFDILVGNTYYSQMEFFENIGTAENPKFDFPVENPFGISASDIPGPYGFPEWVDMDNDGDLDLMLGQFGFGILFFENIGTSTNPNYKAPINQPFGISDRPQTFDAITLGDVDGDGDLDMFSIDGEANGYYLSPKLKYYENIGTASAPNFKAPVENPFGISELGEYVLISELADIDGDGDLDLFTGKYYGELAFYENLRIVGVEEGEAKPTIEVYPNPAVNEINLKGLERECDYRITNSLGKQVMEGKTKKSLNINALSPGVYMIEITVGRDISRLRFLKNYAQPT